MAQSIPASTQAAEEDGAMDDAQQVLEESPTRWVVLILVPNLTNQFLHSWIKFVEMS